MKAIAGSRLEIGLLMPTGHQPVMLDYVNQPWTEIGGLTSLGSIGLNQAWVTQSFISNNFDQQIKGTVGGSVMENVMSPDGSDPGQAKIRSAKCGIYAFRLTSGGCGSVDVTYFTGTPSMGSLNGGEANTPGLESFSITLSVFHPIIEGGVAPAGYSYVINNDGGYVRNASGYRILSGA